MRRIRTFEERVGELFIRGQSAGSMLHLSIGEESSAAGVCAVMKPQDTFTTHHRGHRDFSGARRRPQAHDGGNRRQGNGYCHGKGGSMHIADMALGHLVPMPSSAAAYRRWWARGFQQTPEAGFRITVAFFGDGAMLQGILYESMNMAALWGLPVLFVCINNQYGMGTRIDQATRNTAFDQRAKAFGLNGTVVDGLDVEEVQAAARWLMDEARNGKPGFLSVEVYRFFGHARMDKSPYRDEAEELEGRKKDPVLFARNKLIETGLETEPALDETDRAIAAEMDATIDFTVESKAPQLNTMFRDVYAVGDRSRNPFAPY